MTCHASSTAMFQSLQEKPKSLNGIFVPQMSRGCENPSLTKDPRQLQFEADVNHNEHPLGLSQQASVLPRRSGFSLAVGRNGSSPDNSAVVTNMLLEQLALKRDH
ncbi:hypothetical protein KIW84_055935 [Lathyrus oleraceus]|uniref:Uncharacterized protein n=1 Tax=Pisum sativum TaxID=3888 RepID=A0A9D4X1H5_PEA|nr:hypothetical protein KIW84_055933 [Pisum sativum]KAI5410605.1 hypothetical protein KIW84_055935 [Pisum sativum]